MILSVTKGTLPKDLIFYADFTLPENKALKSKIEFKPIIKDWIGGFSYITNKNNKFYFDTTHKAPNGKVI